MFLLVLLSQPQSPSICPFANIRVKFDTTEQNFIKTRVSALRFFRKKALAVRKTQFPKDKNEPIHTETILISSHEDNLSQCLTSNI